MLFSLKLSPIALCSEIGPLLLRSSGVGVSDVLQSSRAMLESKHRRGGPTALTTALVRRVASLLARNSYCRDKPKRRQPTASSTLLPGQGGAHPFYEEGDHVEEVAALLVDLALTPAAGAALDYLQDAL